jgi:hypothetical protein
LKISLFIPPLTQINTPYPATSYIKGFLNETDYNEVAQSDLGLELILAIFNKKALSALFDEALLKNNLSKNSINILNQRHRYEFCVDAVIRFLQNQNLTLAHKICGSDYLPQASRFNALNEDVEWMFGSMGIHDRAKMLCTLFIEDIGDLIIEAICPYFGFSRYAEDIARSATSFDPILSQLVAQNNSIDNILIRIIDQHLSLEQPDLVVFTIPFPGNVYGAFKAGQHIKKNYPNIKIAMGGGFPNTELRSLSDPRVFDFTDFISLDDGERPLLNILEFLDGKRDISLLKRTFIRENNEVVYIDGAKEADIAHAKSGTPDYTGLLLDSYISMLEMANPMHRLWSDGRWNKMTIAHGCYWKKCSFCDISLDYIGRYEPASASNLADKIEQIIAQTGTTGFHFVDEAAPPLVMRDLAIELIDRKLDISWWANIRFEKTFTDDLCKLLAASGCIAVTGGLEVASDRLLQMMEKGVSVQQVSQVASNFTQSGIMVHAYLMYGFPTQTAQETIDSLEVVRQLFEAGVLQSGFWHRFSMTAHSPVGLNPEKYSVIKIGPEDGTFANNDLIHEDPKGCNHDLYSEGLRKSLYNFMLANCLDWPVHDWFDFKTPKTTLSNKLIQKYINENASQDIDKLACKIVWLGNKPNFIEQGKNTKVEIETIDGLKVGKIDSITAKFLEHQFNGVLLKTKNLLKLSDFFDSYTAETSFPKELLLYSETWKYLRQAGLLLIRF